MKENLLEPFLSGKSMDGTYWKPVWVTIPQMAKIQPLSLWHKEQEVLKLPEVSSEIKNLHILARSSFCLAQSACLQLKISADDRYKLYIDGAFVQEGPAPSHPEHYYYNSIMLPQLEPGEHVLGIHLYYQGCINRVFYSGDLRLALAAELTDGDGREIPLDFFCTRTYAYSGKLIGYDTQFLENFDARLFPADWNQIRPGKREQETLPRTDWSNPEVEGKRSIKSGNMTWERMIPAAWADYRLYPQPVKMLHHEVCRPQEISYEADGSVFLDFGKELTGNLYLQASGRAGDQVIIRCGEECTAFHQVRYDMRCGCRYEEVWTLADGENIWEPFDYKAFRYAQLIPDAGVFIRDIRFAVRHYPMREELCRVHTDWKVLDRIFEICKHAVRLGTQEGYVDCPTREKGQYLGDAVVTAHAQVLLTGETDMLLKCIDQFARTASVCQGLLAVAPGGLMQEIADFSLLYPEMLFLYYRFTGDLHVIENYYSTVEGMVEYFRRFARPDGLLEQVGEKWNLVDWPENLRDGYDFVLSRPVVAAGCHNVVNALYLGAVSRLMRMAELLQKPVPYREELPRLKQAYQKAFYREQTGLFADSESSQHTALHSNVYALYFNLALPKQEAQILDFIEAKGFSCGAMHSYFVLRALAQGGRHDAVCRLLANEGEHDWVQMLREGATACFEAWGKEQKWNTSLCHPWASAPVPIILEEIAGIHPDPACEGGYYFEPHIPDSVKEFCAVMPFRGKWIQVKKQGEKIWLIEEKLPESGHSQ